MKFFKDGFSIDEMKVSALVICLIAAFAIGGYGYIAFGDITGNWLTLMEVLVGAVAGVNAVNLISNGLSNRQNFQNLQQTPAYSQDVTRTQEVAPTASRGDLEGSNTPLI